MSNIQSVSVVSPIYKAYDCLDELYERLVSSLNTITGDFEIILVNDCSPDGSWEKLLELAIKDSRVKLLNLSRNFGQHYAISAGLSMVSKDWVVVMDCDLQDQPEEIGKLFSKTAEGYEVVLAQRLNREDTFLKKSLSRAFYSVLSYLVGAKQDSSVANFGVYHKKVIMALLSTNDNIRYFPLMVRWAGFNKTQIEVKHARRLNGKSSYDFSRMIRLALDIILAYSDKPLRLTVKLGLFLSSISVLFGIYTVYSALQNKIHVLGYASIMVSIWFFGGLILFVLGVLGLYVGKTFEQVKGRPSYIISESINFDKKSLL